MQVVDTVVHLLPAQKAFRRSDAPYRGFVGGIGAGKSWVGALDLIRRAQPGRLYMVIAPTYPMLKDASLRTFVALLQQFKLRHEINRSEMTVTFAGREVLFRSADNPDRLRGPNISGIWMDEASQVSREAFDVAIGRLREGGRHGWLSATFTPKGRSHWTYEVFGKRSPGTDLFHAPTSSNRFIPASFVANLREYYVGLRADQELEGLFVNVEGAEWPAEYFPDDIFFSQWPSDIEHKVVALDPSKGKDASSGDYSALVALGRCRDGFLWVEADLARRHTSRIVADTVDLQRHYRAHVVAVETNQFQELLADDIDRQAREAGVMMPVVHVDNRVNKQVRIRRLGPYLARRQLRFHDDPSTRLLVQQLRDFPEGEHDDGPDGLEMAVRVLGDLLAGVYDE